MYLLVVLDLLQKASSTITLSPPPPPPPDDGGDDDCHPSKGKIRACQTNRRLLFDYRIKRGDFFIFFPQIYTFKLRKVQFVVENVSVK